MSQTFSIIEEIRKWQFSKCRPLEGEFTLPSGKKVWGKLLLDPNHDEMVFLRVIRSPNEQSNPIPKLSHSTIYGVLQSDDRCINYPVIMNGSTQTISKYISNFLPTYDIRCQRILYDYKSVGSRIDSRDVVRIRFLMSNSRTVFSDCQMWPSGFNNRLNILRTITNEIGDEPTDVVHDDGFNRVEYCKLPNEVFSCETEKYGRISARPYDVSTLPHIDIELVIEPRSGCTLDKAESAIECITRFFWLITGERPYASDIRLSVKDATNDAIYGISTAHFLMQEAPLFTDVVQDNSIPSRPLINPVTAREDFEKCLKNWVSLTPNQREGCDIILSQFTEPFHSPIRITRATVAYERFGNLLGDGHKNDERSLTKEIADFANEQIKKKFPEETKDRNDFLCQLGSIPNRITLLDHKIYPHIDRISEYLPLTMKKIKKVAAAAVRSRNTYVHKTDIIDTDSILPIFYANTLEFIFLSSVLIHCGWNPEEEMNGGECTLPPFQRYITNYGELCEMMTKNADD